MLPLVDPVKFAKDVLPQLYKHSNFESFIRQVRTGYELDPFFRDRKISADLLRLPFRSYPFSSLPSFTWSSNLRPSPFLFSKMDIYGVSFPSNSFHFRRSSFFFSFLRKNNNASSPDFPLRGLLFLAEFSSSHLFSSSIGSSSLDANLSLMGESRSSSPPSRLSRSKQAGLPSPTVSDSPLFPSPLQLFPSTENSENDFGFIRSLIGSLLSPSEFSKLSRPFVLARLVSIAPRLSSQFLTSSSFSSLSSLPFPLTTRIGPSPINVELVPNPRPTARGKRQTQLRP